MKLHVLGCCGPYPTAGGATSGYLISHQGENILMDCGSGVLGKLMAVCDPAGLSAVLLSHLHFDHAADLLVMSYLLQMRGRKLTVYVPPEDESPLKGLLSPAVYDVRPYPEEMDIAGIRITTCPTRHPVPCRAIRLEAEGKTLVFTGDTNTCDGLADFSRGADVLLADAAFLETEWLENKPHLSALKAAHLAGAAQVKKLYLTHLPVTHDARTMEKEAAQAFAAVQAVQPGMEIVL